LRVQLRGRSTSMAYRSGGPIRGCKRWNPALSDIPSCWRGPLLTHARLISFWLIVDRSSAEYLCSDDARFVTGSMLVLAVDAPRGSTVENTGKLHAFALAGSGALLRTRRCSTASARPRGVATALSDPAKAKIQGARATTTPNDERALKINSPKQ
jgi:hypothetical protein